MKDYEVKIRESSRELTAREKIRFKDTQSAITIDSSIADENESLTIEPVSYAVLDIHNEHGRDDKDYTNYIIEDSAGNRFSTGSKSCFEHFVEIFETMREEAPDEVYSVTFYKRPAKNYKGKFMLMCKID